MLESGEVKSLREIARKEGVDSSYVSRMVNLTSLAPDIVAAILDETLPSDLTLFDLAVDPPALWEEQWFQMPSRIAVTVQQQSANARHQSYHLPVPDAQRCIGRIWSRRVRVARLPRN